VYQVEGYQNWCGNAPKGADLTPVRWFSAPGAGEAT
jgi:hypothetical protein